MRLPIVAALLALVAGVFADAGHWVRTQCSIYSIVLDRSRYGRIAKPAVVGLEATMHYHARRYVFEQQAELRNAFSDDFLIRTILAKFRGTGESRFGK